jgi:hypothetical protein
VFNFERFIMKSITSALLLISALAVTGAVQAKGPHGSGAGGGTGYGRSADASASGTMTQRRTQDPSLHEGEIGVPRRDRLHTQTPVIADPVVVDSSVVVSQ